MTKDQSAAKISDVVLPIVEISGMPPNLKFERLLGTGFLVAGSKYLISCRHVVLDVRPGMHNLAVRTIDREFITIQLDDLQTHPTHDVAVFRVNIEDHVSSWLLPTALPQHQTLDCQVWGYPADVLYDGDERDNQGRILQRPELVFMKGYIRRRISFPLFGFEGDQFYELNDSAGAGCSGGPLIWIDRTGQWKVFGVYTGEMISEQDGKPVRSRGYAVRMEAVADWLRNIDAAIID